MIIDAIKADLNQDDSKLWAQLNERTQHEMVDFVISDVSDCISILLGCKSPIEELLTLYIYRYFNVRYRIYDDWKFIVDTQYHVSVNGKTYIVDIIIHTQINGKIIDLIIECDGHDFHEKTKAQAAKDKKRDRELSIAGFNVLHFTGSEIWNNPLQCVEEIKDCLLSMAGGGKNA